MKAPVYILLAVAVVSGAALPCTSSKMASFPFCNRALGVSARVADLLARMSLAEKVAQTLHVWTTFHDDDVMRAYAETGVGAMYLQTMSANASCNADAGCRLAARNALQRAIMASSAHGIPISFVAESLHSDYYRRARSSSPPSAAAHSSSSSSSSAQSSCAAEISAACPPPMSPAGCGTCIAAHAPAAFPSCAGSCTDVVPSAVARCVATCAGEALPGVLGAVFPMPNVQGASWNRTLVGAVAAAVAAESRAVGADRGFSPELQVATDPRFGRGQENFGADPHLVSELGVAATHGGQGARPHGAPGPALGPNAYIDGEHLVSEAKHFCAYGHSAFDGQGADVSLATLYNVYLRPWKAYVRRAGGRGAMAGHNAVNGIPMHSNAWLLTHVLRRELGCEDCLIGTDFNDINNLVEFKTANESRYPGFAPATDGSLQALAAGVDQDLGGTAFTTLAAAVQGGLLNESEVTRAAGNVLRAKFAAGLFEQPFTNETLWPSIVDNAAHRGLAKEAAIDGAVLLLNAPCEGRTAAGDSGVAGPNLSVLPLARGLRRIAVVGPNADDPLAMAGGYAPPTIEGQIVTVRAAFEARIGEVGGAHASIEYAQGCDIESDDTSGIAAAVAAANRSDAVVVVLGDSAGTCDEAADRMELDLMGRQIDLLQALLQLGKPVVCMLIHGRPATFGSGHHSRFGDDNAVLSSSGLAILALGRPGEEGGNAAFDVVFGLAQPAGRLAQPWPRSAGYINSRTVPWYNLNQGDYDWGGKPWALVDGNWAPLWCFGFGLAYSNFGLGPMSLSSSVVQATDAEKATVDISVIVSETKRFEPAGAAVVQLYFSPLSASRTNTVRYKKALAGFEKARVSGSANVTVTLSVEDLGYTLWDPIKNTHDWVVDPGQYLLLACQSSCDTSCVNATLTVV